MNNKKFKKVVLVFTIISIIVSVISVTWDYLLPKYISYKILKDLNVNTIGVIGSADGPVSILVSTPNYSYPITTIFTLLSIAGIVYLLVTKNKNNKEDNDYNGV